MSELWTGCPNSGHRYNLDFYFGIRMVWWMGVGGLISVTFFKIKKNILISNALPNKRMIYIIVNNSNPSADAPFESLKCPPSK